MIESLKDIVVGRFMQTLIPWKEIPKEGKKYLHVRTLLWKDKSTEGLMC